MFFVLSKVFWVLMQPLNALCALGLAGWGIRVRWPSLGQRLMNMALIAIILIGLLPIGPVMITWLERQYPTPQTLPQTIDGLILLGGPFEASRSMKTNQLVVNDQIDRGLCFAKLAKEYPNAKLVFTGGAGDITNPQANETPYAKNFFDIVGLSDRKILYESESRNTHENAVLTKALVAPSDSQTWAVITSGYHMPRSMATFHNAGWNVLPYQCDLRTDGTYNPLDGLPNIAANFGLMNLALKEIIGTVAYYVTGKSAFLFPPSTVASGS